MVMGMRGGCGRRGLLCRGSFWRGRILALLVRLARGRGLRMGCFYGVLVLGIGVEERLDLRCSWSLLVCLHLDTFRRETNLTTARTKRS